MEKREVIVAGAGPAGSACAKALMDSGIDVLVLERDPLPRYKTCSGVLFGQTQKLLQRYFQADAPPEVYCSENKLISADNILEWNPTRGYFPYCWEIDKDGESFPRIYQNCWRNLFDKWLLDRSGAEYRDKAQVHSFETQADHVVVRLRGGREQNGPSEYSCKYLVGADGGISAIRKGLNAEVDTPYPPVGVLQSYFKIESLDTLKPGAWVVFFDPEICEALCAALQKDHYLVLSVGGFKGRNLREALVKLRKMVTDNFEVRLGEVWRDEGCQVTLGPPYCGEGRVLVTGEAGGFMYLNGEGISAAIDSGYRCGKAIAGAIRGEGKAVDIYAETTKDIVAHIRKCLSQIHFLATPSRKARPQP